MAEPLHNPLPVPKKKDHREMEFDLKDEVVFSMPDEDKQKLKEDDFDFPVSDDDDFDI